MSSEKSRTLSHQLKITDSRYLWFLMMAYAMAAFSAGWFDPRQIRIFGINTGAGSIAFPLTYLLADVITEVYGYKKARRAIFAGILFFPIFLFYGQLVVHFISPQASNKPALTLFLQFDGYILIASLANYFITESANAYLLAKLKIALHGKYIGLRFICSTLFAYVLDELIYAPIAFHGMMNIHELIKHMLGSWAFMVSIELLLLPLSVRIAKYLKKVEKIDTYDNKTNFNPFSLDSDYSKEDNKYKGD